jgi:hypothetical protein
MRILPEVKTGGKKLDAVFGLLGSRDDQRRPVLT